MFLKNRKSVLFCSLLAVSLVSSVGAFADDDTVRAGLREAQELFEKRSADPKSMEGVLAKLAPLEDQADDSDLNYDVLVLESRALYWQGQHAATRDEKLTYHQQGQAKADQAKTLNEGYPEGYYFAGINLARWGEAKGVIESVSRKGELFEYMNNAISHVSRDGKSGEILDGYGPHRVLGKVYSVLPFFLGGSHSEAVNHLKKAVDNAKDVALNVVYYADTLNAGSSTEKAQAKQLLDEMLANDPTTYNPTRVPETLEEFEMARKLRGQMN